MSRADLIHQLRERLQNMEQGHSAARRAVVATGTPLDRLLPGKGWEPGTLIEWLSDGDGAGAATLALAVSAQLLRNGGGFVAIDREGEFYPPAAASLGIPLERTAIMRPHGARETLWVWEQALRSPAAAVVWGWLETIDDRAFRRLQLAAETGNGFGFLIRPASCRGEPSWAAVRLLIEAIPAGFSSSGRRLRIELPHGRGGAGAGAVEVELSDETDPVCVAAPLAHPASLPRGTGA